MLSNHSIRKKTRVYWTSVREVVQKKTLIFKRSSKGKDKDMSKKTKLLIDVFKRKEVTHVPIEVVYMDIAGESVPVHIMDCIADDPSEDADQIEIRPRSPENYEQTFAYFEAISVCRIHVTAAITELGELLRRGIILGDKEEWGVYVKQLEDDVHAWKQRCRESDRIFQNGKIVVGQIERDRRQSLYYRLMRAVCAGAESVLGAFTCFSCPIIDS
ncbi:hypothetical protein DPMN_068795 [Dreissena polymorpha]|uniref:Uncharacterized protein n=1 Tax=Dreissena polymorpha TaxID=45954 RepID=A0A9D3YY87_DREPO|nr:hypothetical protein DPMN_068795 [Dreissena polymorpha]